MDMDNEGPGVECPDMDVDADADMELGQGKVESSSNYTYTSSSSSPGNFRQYDIEAAYMSEWANVADKFQSMSTMSEDAKREMIPYSSSKKSTSSTWDHSTKPCEQNQAEQFAKDLARATYVSLKDQNNRNSPKTTVVRTRSTSTSYSSKSQKPENKISTTEQQGEPFDFGKSLQPLNLLIYPTIRKAFEKRMVNSNVCLSTYFPDNLPIELSRIIKERKWTLSNIYELDDLFSNPLNYYYKYMKLPKRKRTQGPDDDFEDSCETQEDFEARISNFQTVRPLKMMRTKVADIAAQTIGIASFVPTGAKNELTMEEQCSIQKIKMNLERHAHKLILTELKAGNSFEGKFIQVALSHLRHYCSN